MNQMPRHRKHYALSFLLFSLLLLVLLFLYGTISKRLFSPADTDAGTRHSPQITVILDPGHGGEDGGAVGKNGVYEKDLNLSIAKKLSEQLADMNVSVICTRTEDILLYDKTQDYKGKKKILDLAARLKIARDTENPIFISIHMNAFSQTQYSGLQVYYSKNDPRSEELARCIQNAVQKELQPTNTRKIKQASTNIYLLDRITTPAILIECGFLSNPEECALLSTDEYQEALTFLLADVIAEYVASLS